MKICFIADARSPIARNWISWFVQRGHSVCVISSYATAGDCIPGAKVHCIPLLTNQFARVRHNGTVANGAGSSGMSRLLAEFRTGRLAQATNAMRYWAAPLELPFHVTEVRAVLDAFRPDIVHAMRIPFEAILAAKAGGGYPLLVSIWGNDLTLFAADFRFIAQLTRTTLARADALHCDCFRDSRLAAEKWGFDNSKPSVVLPTSGGAQMDMFFPGLPDARLLASLGISATAPVVINPRGFRAYVRNDTFFKAIPAVLQKHPDAIFIAVGMKDNPIADRWVKKLGIGSSIRLLGEMRREQMAELFRSAWINLSITEHDGLPNTLVESLACGVFPVAGDIESIREWIEDGVNGLLVPPGDADAVAAAVLRAIDDGELRRSAAMKNREAVEMRGDYAKIMPLAEKFYEKVIAFRSATSPGNNVRTRPTEQIE